MFRLTLFKETHLPALLLLGGVSAAERGQRVPSPQCPVLAAREGLSRWLHASGLSPPDISPACDKAASGRRGAGGLSL